jgi:CRP/FNR family cyclic AMP-dependent transcriptional regulator
MIAIQDARNYLQRYGWLADTHASFANKLLRRCQMTSLPRGSTPFRMGEEPDGLRGIVSGGFAFDIAMHERGPHLAHVFRPGAWFGELELFGGIPKISSITATRPSVILHLDQENFEDLVEDIPEAWRWIGLLASQHLELAIGVVDDSSIRDPAHRIGALLLRLADVRRNNNSNDPQPTIDIKQSDLAHLAVVSRSTLVSHLQDLERVGLISRQYSLIKLLDPAQLRKQIAEALRRY